MAESPYIIDVTRDNYAQVMEASFKVPVLIDFWASWCQPCQVLMPILARLADEYQGKFLLGKLNTEEQQEIAAQFGIRSIPTVKLFRDGQPVDEFMGALPEGAVRQFLDRHVARESDTQLDEARDLLRTGNTDGAIALLEEAYGLKVSLIDTLKHETLIVYDLNFNTIQDEYQYMINRTYHYLDLVQIALSKSDIDDQTRKLTDKYVYGSMMNLESAENFELQGQFSEAIPVLDKTINQLSAVLKILGIEI